MALVGLKCHNSGLKSPYSRKKTHLCYTNIHVLLFQTLWEVNVDPESQKIPIHQLCVELKAGGVSLEHEREVREKLGPLRALDLLDFLTYIPLFLMIHTSVVGNPLDDSRQK